MCWDCPLSPRSKNLQVVTSVNKRLATVCSDHKDVLIEDLVQQGTRANVGSYSVKLLLIRADFKT